MLSRKLNPECQTKMNEKFRKFVVYDLSPIQLANIRSYRIVANCRTCPLVAKWRIAFTSRIC